MSRASVPAAGSSAVAISTLEPVVVVPSSKAQSPQTSTSSGASSDSQSSQSSQSSQTSPSAPTSSTSTTNNPGPSDSSTNSPVASSSSVPTRSSITSTSSNTSESLRIGSASAPNVPDPSSTTLTTITSAPALTPSPSSSQSLPQSSTGGVSFFHNKPAMIAVFAGAGVFILVVVLIFVIVALRWKRRKDLIESALDFSPTTEHLVNDDDYGGGGGGSSADLLSRSSGSMSSESRGTRPRVPSVILGATPSLPALAPVSVPPASIPAPREMQQRGYGTGYTSDRYLDRGETSGARYAYGNSGHPYYDTVRQQQPPPSQPPQRWQYQQQQQQQQQQQLQYQPQQQTRSLRGQQQEERSLTPDVPVDVGPIPLSLMPSSERDATVFDVPFATTTTKPSRLSSDGGLGGAGGADRTWVSRTNTRERRERRQTQQVPLPPPAMFPRKTPDTLGRNDESLGDISVSVEEDRRNLPRLLKVVNG